MLTKVIIKPNSSDDFSKITDEVLSNFKSVKLQSRKSELLNLMKQTTDITLLNKYQSELREIIQNSARR